MRKKGQRVSDTTPSTPTSVRLAHEAPIAFAHEHGRLYDAIEHAAQIAELAGHDSMAASLRRHRRHVGVEIAEASCSLSPRGLDDAEIASLTARTIRELEADAEADDGG